MAGLKKGSKAAKDFMAKIRAAKGKTKPKKVALKKIGYKPDRMAIVKKATKKISAYKAKGYTRKDAIKLANKDAAFSVNGIQKTINGMQKTYMAIYQNKGQIINDAIFSASSLLEAKKYASAYKRHTPEFKKYKSISTSVKLYKN